MKKSFEIGMCSIIILLYFVLHSVNAFSDDSHELSSYLQNVPFELGEIFLPKIPDYAVNIVDYGAVGDGHTSNTEAIDKAIDACARAGGGRVVIPAGIWLTGPIQFQSNINLHLKANALLLFSRDINDYPIIRTSYEGEQRVKCMSPISGINLENIAITGQGIIDGSGDAWRPLKKEKLTDKQWRELVASGGAVSGDGSIWYPSENALNGRETVRRLRQAGNASIDDFRAAGEFLRPVMISFVECKNVLLDGPTFQNSPAWNIHPLMCENLIIRNISVRNPWYSQNGDGIDFESCRNALLYNSRFDVGDDAICIKSGRDEAGRKRGRPCENIVIADCIVYHGHGGFTVGSEMSGGVRNMLIRDCVFIGTDVGLRFKSTRGRGGVVENISITNISMIDIRTDAIRFNMFYQGNEPLASIDVTGNRDMPGVTEETPAFRKIYMNNIICKGADRAVFMQGLPELAITDIQFNHVKMTAKHGFLGVDAKHILLNEVNIQPETGPAFHFMNCQHITFEKLNDLPNTASMLKLEGKITTDIKIKQPEFRQLESKIELGKNVSKDAVVWE